MARYIKVPVSLILLANLCKKHKILYMRVFDDSLNPKVESYPFVIQYRCQNSFIWHDLNRYQYWSEARDAMIRLVDRYENILLE